MSAKDMVCDVKERLTFELWTLKFNQFIFLVQLKV